MSHNKIIPEYAIQYKREWQYISGINKKCGNFINILDIDDKYIFNSHSANSLKCYIKKFLKAQERGRLKDISSFYFKYFDASNIECLLEQMGEYYDLYEESYGSEINEEYFDFYIDINFPGYKEFLELICLINDKVKKEDPIFKNNIDSTLSNASA